MEVNTKVIVYLSAIDNSSVAILWGGNAPILGDELILEGKKWAVERIVHDVLKVDDVRLGVVWVQISPCSLAPFWTEDDKRYLVKETKEALNNLKMLIEPHKWN